MSTIPSSDEGLREAGGVIPGPGASPVEPDVAAPLLKTPEVTKAQLVGSVPVIAKLLSAFGVYTLSHAQEEALTLAVGGGAVLFLADAAIRAGRSLGNTRRA